MSVPTCFESIIGFSRKENLCVTEDWDADYATSESGLYIDELPGFPQGFVDSLGGNYDIWEKMTNSLENAVRAFKIDVMAEILKYWEPARKRYKGDIGGRSFTNTISACGTYAGLRMYSDIIGGTYIVRGFWLILNVTEAVTLEIYDEYDLLHTYTLNATAGKPTYTAITPLELTLDRNYYFLYTSSGLPYNNKLTCNCGGYKWCFNEENPCFKASRDGWTEWAMVGGVCGTDLDERDDWSVTREGAGMIIHGDFTCDILGTLCTEHSDWTTEIGFAIANAIWYKTGDFLSVYVMDSEEVSRKTLLGTEQWASNRAYYLERYTAMLNFIAENFEAEENDCLKCRPPLGYSKRIQML
jgi:hypothetical protein